MGNVLDNIIDRLTDNYNKDPDSNVSKLMKIAAHHIQENEDLLVKMNEWQDIDLAQGAVLDRIGKDEQQRRGKASDEVYRVLIKARIKRAMSDASINTIVDFLSFILQIDTQEVKVTELWKVGRGAALHIDVPPGAVNRTGLTLAQFGRLVNLVVAAGVKAEVLFEGTFSFSSSYTESEYDPNGFSNDEETTGGTWGYIYDPAGDIELPY